ncbi:c-type cytochrome [Hyphomonas sp.]|uniref:c-type cytochrome n=1 Tax=Hyphomonas sp. TaxID=87 RepID=UPI0032EC4938|tara:strand:+ start:28304 stop:29131 length:828 start_codon:yes stop_codon:yes gene_type:complete
MNEIWKAVASGLISMSAVACDQESHAPPDSSVVVLTFDGADATSNEAIIQHGNRLSKVLGCTGCHNQDLSGGPFNEGWIAPNLTLKVSEYDDLALDQAIRAGIALDGRKIRLMPSEMYRSLSGKDVEALILYLRSLDPVGQAQPAFEPFASDLVQWEADGYTDANALGLAWSEADGPVMLGPEQARGRYLAMNLCTECHNDRLQGYPGFTPDLAIIAAYSDDAFNRLLHKGKGNVREELGLMSMVSPARFQHLTDRELAELTDYLRARASARREQ